MDFLKLNIQIKRINVTNNSSSSSSSSSNNNNKEYPIIFIHGWLDSLKTWSLIIKSLQSQNIDLNERKELNIILISLRGWGNSEKNGEYSINSYAEDVINFLNKENIHEYILCGHSMGTLVSTKISSLYPNNVKGLILCGAAAKMQPDHILDPSNSLTLGQLNTTITELFPDGPLSNEGESLLKSFQCDDLYPLVDSGVIPSEFISQVLEETFKATPRSYREAFNDMIQEDHTSELLNIICPTLIIWGTNDVLFDRNEQDQLKSFLINSSNISFKEVINAPHGVIWTHANECSQIIEEWLNEQFD